MPLTYKARNGTTYFLHTGPKRGGGVQYFVSQSPDGTLADSLPKGFELYGTVNSQVYVRRKQPALITEGEVQTIRNLPGRRAAPSRCKAEVKGKELLIYELY